MRDIVTNLTEAEAEILESYLSKEESPMASVLVELGSADKDLYFLKMGSCKVYQKVKLGQKLFALDVGVVEAPAIIGEANLLLGEKRNATILSSTELQYFKLTPDAFEKLKEEQPKLAIKLLEFIGGAVSERFLKMQRTLMDRFLAEEPKPTRGLEYLKKFMGAAHPCSKDLAQKLFNMEQPDIGGTTYQTSTPPTD